MIHILMIDPLGRILYSKLFSATQIASLLITHSSSVSSLFLQFICSFVFHFPPFRRVGWRLQCRTSHRLSHQRECNGARRLGLPYLYVLVWCTWRKERCEKQKQPRSGMTIVKFCHSTYNVSNSGGERRFLTLGPLCTLRCRKNRETEKKISILPSITSLYFKINIKYKVGIIEDYFV